jgi:integrase
LFSSHSFRRGGATLLANAGIPSNMIQLMGDWKSDAYKKYIVNDLSDRLKVANKIKKFVICQER